MRTPLYAIAISGCFLWHTASAETIEISVQGEARDCFLGAQARNVKAIPVCDRALKAEALSPRDRAATLTNRSALKIQTGDLSGALADTDESIQVFDGLAVTYLNRGVALTALGQAKEAIATLNTCIDLGFAQPELAYYDRALAKENAGDIAGAYSDFRTALAVAPDFKPAEEQIKRFHFKTNKA